MNTLTVPLDERDHLRGSSDAPVVLVEYADFECPYRGEACEPSVLASIMQVAAKAS